MPIKKTNQHASQIECSAVSLNTFFFSLSLLAWLASILDNRCLPFGRMLDRLRHMRRHVADHFSWAIFAYASQQFRSVATRAQAPSRWFKSKTRRNRSGEKKRPGELWKVAVRCFSRLRILVFFLIKKRAGPIVKKEIWILVSRVAEAIPGIT